MVEKAAKFQSLFATLVTLCFALLAPDLRAEIKPIPDAQDMSISTFTRQLRILEDPENRLDFPQLLSGAEADRFQAVEKDSFNRLEGTHWFKGLIENKQDHPVTVYVQFDNSTHVQLGIYPELHPDQSQTFEGGWKSAFRQRSIKFLNPTFEITLPPGKSTLLIKAEGLRFYLSIGSKDCTARK